MLKFITQITLKGVYNAHFQIEVIKHENCLQYDSIRVSLMTQMLKNLPAMQETWVQSLGQEDFLGEGNSNPLQYPCPGNPMDRRAWRATAVHEVAKE